MKFLKGTKLYSIFTGTCPVCHEASMYESKRLYNTSKTLSMNERCAHCDTKFKIEPSFFYGSMYVSYAVGVAFGIASFAVSYWLLNTSLLGAFFAIVGVLVVSLPVILRLSRNIWINLFFNYDKNKAMGSPRKTD